MPPFAAIVASQLTATTVTVWPLRVRVPFQPLRTPAPAAGQVNVRGQPLIAVAALLVSGFVVSPSGTSPDGFPNSGFCAWHDWNGTTAYTNMPYVLDAGAGCGADSVQNQLDGFSIVGGHEYAEAITDPKPASGWVDASGEEIGDLCAWQNLTALSLSTGTFAIQPAVEQQRRRLRHLRLTVPR